MERLVETTEKNVQFIRTLLLGLSEGQVTSE